MAYNVPGRADVHVDKPLTSISIMFRLNAEDYVSERVFPVVPVPKQSDLYFTIPRGAFFRDSFEKKAPGAPPARVNFKHSTDSYRCDIWALATTIADEVRANYDAPLRADQEMTELLTNLSLINKERQWQAAYFAAGIWTTDQTGVAAAPGANQFLQWNDANSNPIVDIRAGKRRVQQRTGYRPNKLVLGREVFDVLVDHPDIIALLDRGQTPVGPAQANRQALAAIFEVEEVLVMDGIHNTAAMTQTDTMTGAFIGGKAALLIYVPRSAGLQTVSAGYTFTWTGLLGGGAMGQNMRRVRDDRLLLDELIAQMAYDFKVVSADLGQFFASAIA